MKVMGLLLGLLLSVVLIQAAPARAEAAKSATKPTSAAAKTPSTKPHAATRPAVAAAKTPSTKPHAATRPQKSSDKPHATSRQAQHNDQDARVSLWKEMRSTQWWSAVQHWIIECSEANWPKASAFMKKNSPHRWRAYESLEADSKAQRGVRRYILARYNNLLSLKKHDPALYKLQLDELKLEDQIFGAAAGRRFHRRDEKLDQRLKGLAGELVDLQLKIRQMRIERLVKALASAKARLKKDQGRRDQLVKEELERVEKYARPPHRPRPSTRPAK